MYTYIEDSIQKSVMQIDELTEVYEFQFLGVDENDNQTLFFLVIYNEVGNTLTYQKFKDRMIEDYEGMPDFGFSEEDYQKMWDEAA